MFTVQAIGPTQLIYGNFFLSPSVKGRNRILHLRVMSRAFYHCALALDSNPQCKTTTWVEVAPVTRTLVCAYFCELALVKLLPMVAYKLTLPANIDLGGGSYNHKNLDLCLLLRACLSEAPTNGSLQAHPPCI
jgi:hypothetical protein